MDVRQLTNEKKYDFAASSYGAFAYILSLGLAKRLYRRVADAMAVQPSGTIVELGCGPASVVPYLLEKTDGSNQIIAVDFSQQMIDIANRKKESNLWANVDFKCMDIYDIPESTKADVVIFCLSLTAIPDSQKALQKALKILKPGGRLVIVDSIPLHSRWYHWFTNTYIFFKSLIVGAKPTEKIFGFLKENMADVRTDEIAYGVYTLIVATKPA